MFNMFIYIAYLITRGLSCQGCGSIFPRNQTKDFSQSTKMRNFNPPATQIESFVNLCQTWKIWLGEGKLGRKWVDWGRGTSCRIFDQRPERWTGCVQKPFTGAYISYLVFVFFWKIRRIQIQTKTRLQGTAIAQSISNLLHLKIPQGPRYEQVEILL